MSITRVRLANEADRQGSNTDSPRVQESGQSLQVVITGGYKVLQGLSSCCHWLRQGCVADDDGTSGPKFPSNGE